MSTWLTTRLDYTHDYQVWNLDRVTRITLSEGAIELNGVSVTRWCVLFDRVPVYAGDGEGEASYMDALDWLAGIECLVDADRTDGESESGHDFHQRMKARALQPTEAT